MFDFNFINGKLFFESYKNLLINNWAFNETFYQQKILIENMANNTEVKKDLKELEYEDLNNDGKQFFENFSFIVHDEIKTGFYKNN